MTAVVAVVLGELTPAVPWIAIDTLFTDNRSLAAALPLVPDAWIPAGRQAQV